MTKIHVILIVFLTYQVLTIWKVLLLLKLYLFNKQVS